MKAPTTSKGRKVLQKPRIKSGIPRLDYILKGGLLEGGLYTLKGPPGSGKTIFGNQFCFNLAEQGFRCVYVTLLAESHAKMLDHIRPLGFFDDSKIPEFVYYISAYAALKKDGLKGLLDLVKKSITLQKATLLVMDGLENVVGVSGADQNFKEFIHELQGYLTIVKCTSLVLSAFRPYHIEDTLADGNIELSDYLIGPRAVRELTVHKFRGSDYLRGKHEVEITKDGIVIHPRTEIQFDKPAENATENRVRMAFGIPTLDRMLDGGVPSGSALALIGAPGTGKTTLGLTFLVEGARKGQKGIYFGFYEPPPRLIEKARDLGIELEKYVKKGLIELIWQPPLEHFMDSLAEQLLEKIRTDDSTRRRLFIDGIEGFNAASVYPDRMPRFLSALTNQLRTLDVTTLVTEELGLFKPELDMPTPELANVVESVILMRYVELRSQLYRLLSIMKMRESRYDTSIREFKIASNGIEVADSFRSAEAILSGHARLTSAIQRPTRTQRKK